jgi:3-oxoadipate enol-lactonase
MPLSFRDGWPERHPRRYAALLAARLTTPTPPFAWRAQYAACEEHLRTGLADQLIEVPTLIVHGTADRVVPYDNAAQAARVCPASTTLTLPGAGHLCWLEEPSRVTAALIDHIAGVDGPQDAA